MVISIGQVGLGYWGPNLSRNISSTHGARLYAITDLDKERLTMVGNQYPEARLYDQYDAMLRDPVIDAIVISTPVHLHYEMALSALRAGKHVFVEKPLSKTSIESVRLIKMADSKNLVLMVGHVFLHSAHVKAIKNYIDSGELGEVYYITSQRLNFGIIRQDVNALWNFAPHDFSIINFILQSSPTNVSAHGYSYIQPDIEDVVYVNLDYSNGVHAHIHISWLDPQKVRRMTIVGSKKMLVYDDVSPDSKITIYDREMTLQPKVGATLGNFETYHQFQTLVRSGDILIPKIQSWEPLQKECQHFVDCINKGINPLTDGQNGLEVVSCLEAAELSMNNNAPQKLSLSK